MKHTSDIQLKGLGVALEHSKKRNWRWRDADRGNTFRDGR